MKGSIAQCPLVLLSDKLWGIVPVVEPPGAARIRGRVGQHHRDVMIGRRQVVFRAAITLAAWTDLAVSVDAQTVHDVFGPPASIAVARQSVFGGQHPVAAVRGDMTQKVGLVAKQPKPALDLPGDLRAHGRRIGLRPARRPAKSQAEYDEGEEDCRFTHSQLPFLSLPLRYAPLAPRMWR